MALSQLTKIGVSKAVQEYDRLGRHAFLKKYGFQKAKGYYLSVNNKIYDSKAIAGAAHGYTPGPSPLKASEFNGGELTVKRTLESLGFKVIGPDDIGFPPFGTVLNNEEIGLYFGVSNMGGMRRSLKKNLLVLISDPFKGLYEDRWVDDVLHYTGMGKTGNQSLSYSQNKTLTNSAALGISTHLLEAFDPERYTYLGEARLAGKPYQEEQPDITGKNRMVWMFPISLAHNQIRPALTADQAHKIEEAHSQIARRFSTEELKARASKANKKPSARRTSALSYIRDAAVSEYTKRLANGICDLCEKPAPFLNKRNEAYLECHHIVWLARGGEDTIRNTVALCPNCHRRVHVLDNKSDKAELKKKAARREKR